MNPRFFNRAKSIGFTIPHFQNSEDCFDGTKCLILNGKKLSHHYIEEAKKLCSAHSVKPCLAVILVGENPASQVYVKNKLKMFEQTGFQSKSYFFSQQETSEKKLLELIHTLNQDSNVHGILVQLPLPNLFSQELVLNAIAPEKDVDGFLAPNIGSLALGTFNSSLACTPFGVMTLLSAYQVSFAGKHAVVVGRSNIVGKPISLLLLSEDATVTIAHSKTRNLIEVCQQADIVIAAAGVPKLIDKRFVKPGAVVVDIGIHRQINGELCGDVNANVREIASSLSPVPGGVGPMTISMLMINTAIAAW